MPVFPILTDTQQCTKYALYLAGMVGIPRDLQRASIFPEIAGASE
jgi:hypothetical protein